MNRWLASFLFWIALAVTAAAQTATYRLQPGDLLSITVWQDSKLDRTVVVGPDGSVSIPLAGHVQASGQTVQAVEAELRRRLQPSYTTALDVTVSLGAVTVRDSALSIFVTGEVAKPGSYPLNPLGTNVLQAIAVSGGFSPFAATRRIQVVRRLSSDQAATFTFNYDDLISGRAPGANIDLRAGDVVVVPEKGLFGR